MTGQDKFLISRYLEIAASQIAGKDCRILSQIFLDSRATGFDYEWEITVGLNVTAVARGDYHHLTYVEYH